jgi:hypothetical protein
MNMVPSTPDKVRAALAWGDVTADILVLACAAVCSLAAFILAVLAIGGGR